MLSNVIISMLYKSIVNVLYNIEIITLDSIFKDVVMHWERTHNLFEKQIKTTVRPSNVYLSSVIFNSRTQNILQK